MRRKFCHAAVGFVLMSGVCSGAQARFVTTDADQIDQEERYGLETWNDKLSYLFPMSWDHLWRQSDTGYRVSAGSLNQTRFDFREDIKLQAGAQQVFSFAFFQQRREDMVEQVQERELRTAWRFLPAWRLALLADGGTFKEYGDLGGALILSPDRARVLEFYYWSVDHFYNSKKSEASDKRNQPALTTGLRGDWEFPQGLKVKFDFNNDAPFVWQRRSRGYTYAYEKRAFTCETQIPFVNISRAAEGESSTASGDLFLRYIQEFKGEAKAWYEGDKSVSGKSMIRRVHQYEGGAIWKAHGHDVKVGMQHLTRTADYDHWQAAEVEVEEKQYSEPPSPSWVRRWETAVYGVYYAANVLGSRHGWQLGSYINDVHIREVETKFKGTEVKLQTAWDYMITDKARIFLNLTWDLDQLSRDFPYKKKAFRPWGGGNLQFIAVY